MGTYTEIVLGCSLKRDTPEKIINILKHMVGDIKEKPDVPDHELFETYGWDVMLRCGSSYFSWGRSELIFDDYSKAYSLSIRSNFKNYDDEIDKFLKFILPYSYTRGFVGYSRYEENAHPTLIYFNEYEVDND